MKDVFTLTGRVAVVTGGYGVLGGAMARALAGAGARVVTVGRNADRSRRFAESLSPAGGHLGLSADVTDRESVGDAVKAVVAQYGRLDVLVNAAGGNLPGATVGPDEEAFSLDLGAMEEVYRLNLQGTVIPSLACARAMLQGGTGSIVNISSVSAETPLTRVAGYGAAKAGVEHFTRWLAVELAQKQGAGLRVNAIRPGFFVADQNRALLLENDGSPTTRGRAILAHTPAGRFGKPEDLAGAVLFLASDASRFVTGSVVTVDGGFGAQRGV